MIDIVRETESCRVKIVMDVVQAREVREIARSCNFYAEKAHLGIDLR